MWPAFGRGAALTAGVFSHTSMVFFTGALLAAWAVPAVRRSRPAEVFAALAPYAAIPAIYTYFLLTDRWSSLWRQLAPMRGNVIAGQLLGLAWRGEWAELGGRLAAFLHDHVGNLVVWGGALVCLLLPSLVPDRSATAARHFASAWTVCLATHFPFLKRFVLTYRSI